MAILNIIGSIVAIIILLFIAVIVSMPVPRYKVPIGKNPLRSLDKDKVEK